MFQSVSGATDSRNGFSLLEVPFHKAWVCSTIDLYIGMLYIYISFQHGMVHPLVSVSAPVKTTCQMIDRKARTKDPTTSPRGSADKVSPALARALRNVLQITRFFAPRLAESCVRVLGAHAIVIAAWSWSRSRSWPHPQKTLGHSTTSSEGEPVSPESFPNTNNGLESMPISLSLSFPNTNYETVIFAYHWGG